MNKQMVEMVKLANEDVETGNDLTVYLDGPGWIEAKSVAYTAEDDLVLITLASGDGFISAPSQRVVAIRAIKSIGAIVGSYSA